MFEKLDNTQLAAHIADLKASKPQPTALDFEAHVNRLEAANRELTVRELTAQLTAQQGAATVNVEAVAQLEAANTTITEMQTAANQNAEQITQLTAQLETVNADLQAATSNLTEVQGTLTEMQAAHTKLEKKASAYEKFIGGQYGDETVAAFKADGSGEITQPEVAENPVYLTPAQQRQKNKIEARKMAKAYAAKLAGVKE